MPLEFRVRWQREGRQPSHRIYQTWESACRRVRTVQAVDAIKADFQRLASMPDLTGPPELQVREVGEWRRHDYQPKANDYDRDRLREHFEWTEPSQVRQADDESDPF